MGARHARSRPAYLPPMIVITGESAAPRNLQSAVYDSINDSKKRKTPTADSCGGSCFGF